MKIIFTIIILAVITTRTIAQDYGYSFCNDTTFSVQIGDSVALDIDGLPGPDMFIGMYHHATYGKVAQLFTLKPNTGSTYLREVRFKTDGTGYGFVNNYLPNVVLPSYLLSGEVYGSYPFLTASTNLGHFFPGDTGYVCYRHGGGYSVYYDPDFFEYDTSYYWCMGWMRFTVGGNYDSVTYLGSCGCDKYNMVSGKSLPHATGILENPESSFEVINTGDRIALRTEGELSLSYALRTLSGQEVMRGDAGGGSPLDMSWLAAGMYILEVYDRERLLGVYKVLRR